MSRDCEISVIFLEDLIPILTLYIIYLELGKPFLRVVFAPNTIEKIFRDFEISTNIHQLTRWKYEWTRNWTIENVDETMLKHLTNCTSMKNFMLFEIISGVSAHLKNT